MQLLEGYCPKSSVFYRSKKVPRPLEASIEGLKSIFRANKILSTSLEASQGSGTFSLLLNTEFLGQYPCTFQTSACTLHCFMMVIILGIIWPFSIVFSLSIPTDYDAFQTFKCVFKMANHTCSVIWGGNRWVLSA